MSSKLAPCYVTAPGVDTLALAVSALKAEFSDPFALAQVTVWVPNSRAALALKEQFLAGAQTQVLPQIRILGVDDAPQQRSDVLTAAEKHAVFSSLLQQHEPELAAAQASHIASSLVSLHNQLVTNDVPRVRLSELVTDENHAAHWQRNQAWLLAVWEGYDTWLKEHQRFDPAQHSRQQLWAQTQQYQQPDFDQPVWVVGLVDTTKPAQQLMRAVAQLAQGTLVFPGVDLAPLQQELTFTAADAPLQQLLKALDIPVEHVQAWGEKAATPEVQVASCADSAQEAGLIALQLRQAIAQQQKVAVVTPDRRLASMVQQQCVAWGLVVDDSAGQPLLHTPHGQLLMLSLAVFVERYAAVPLLDLLKHPLLNLVKEQRDAAHTLERDVLRGTAEQGLAAYRRRVKSAVQRELLDTVQGWYRSWDAASKQPLETWLTQHQQLMTQLVENVDDEPWQNVWEVLGSGVPVQLDIYGYTAWLEQALQQETVRQEGTVPNVFIWGPLEARLQQVDKVVLAGSVQGVWPHTAKVSPWLNRAQRAQLGLPSADIQLGLNHHDWRQLCHHTEVLVTCSASHHGEAAEPSRWLASTATTALPEHWFSWVRQWQQQGEASQTQHAMSWHPRAEQLPMRWSPSLVAELVQCPYKAFARRALKLEAWEPLTPQYDARGLGIAVHGWLEGLVAAVRGVPSTPYQGDWQDSSQLTTFLLDILPAALADLPKLSRTLWQPRLQALAPKLAARLAQQAQHGFVPAQAEAKLEARLGDVTMMGYADRVDQGSGRVAVVDYKTQSQLDATSSLKSGAAPQLAVLQWLLHQNNQAVDSVALWGLAKGGAGVDVQGVFSGEDLAQMLEDTADGLARYVHHFVAENGLWPAVPGGQSTLKLEQQCRGCGYRGLCRVREWADA